MSIAVLRTFITKRREEHEARFSKTKMVAKASDKDSSGPDQEEVPNDSATNNEISNEVCEVPEKILKDESCDISEVAKTIERGPALLKPPRVLEVF